MPRKSITRRSRNKKEKQILTARLIEISLKVEDYIYKQNPISVSEAEQYSREVNSYKTQCFGDERSLQVIEKLTRCMRAILVDHQEQGHDVYFTNDGSSIPHNEGRAGSISPVYSIPDEDRTQLTETAEGNSRNITEANKDVEIIDLSNIDDDDSVLNEMTNSTDNESSRINVEVDIHKAISNLSLKEVEKPLEISTDANFSQSILNNFEGIETETIHRGLNNVSDVGKTTNADEKADKTFAKTTSNNNFLTKIKNNEPATIQPIIFLNTLTVVETTNTKDKTVVHNKENMKVNNATNRSVNTLHQNNHQKTYSSMSINNSQSQTFYDSNITCTINTSGHVQKHTQPAQFQKVAPKNSSQFNNTVENAANFNVPKNMTTNTDKTLKAKINNDIKINKAVIENSTPIKKKRAPRKKKTLEETGIKPKTKKVFRASKKVNDNASRNLTQKEDNVSIYNKNVENDLSWIENIRYVREIRTDENISNLHLEESFWDNYYLPSNWNEGDFF